ncbi:MAG TPA: aminotransferase class III-fold pyridoxal phosphate-dependent enzyme [Solirubrobacteraceae bacterium]|nr:aminotransferase class III-fold pyridoxal phosphate-dependent enzyme [Solirubrobacteraceae bacterium]
MPGANRGASEPLDPLGILDDARARSGEALGLAARHLDPSLVDVLRIIGFDEPYVSARGSYLYDARGRAYLDLHTGEGFASLGHNHPDVRSVLQAALGEDLLDGVQIHYSVLAGMLAEALAARLPHGIDAFFFASTGAEAVDAAMKFARAATGRGRFVSCESGFHGVTLGPLSLVGDEFFKEGFGPLLAGCELVPFGDLDGLESRLRRRDVAAFVVEPVQGRTVAPPPPGYLRGAQELCRRYGTMFVLDEIQTGLGRTGRWFALEEWGLEPDFVLVGKALSGGYMPVAAMATTRDIYQRAVGTLERSYVHQSTFGRNRLSMAAGLATVRVIERDDLVEHAAHVGGLLRDGLAELQARHQIVREIRARGLMIGIELGAPRGSVARLSWRLVRVAAEGLYPQLIVIPLHRDHGVITMAAGKNDVVKLLPPLTLSEAEAQSFLGAFDAVLADCEGSAGKNWVVVRDIAKATLRRRGQESPEVAVAAGALESPEVAVAAPALESPAVTARPRPSSPGGGERVLITGATGFIGGRLARRLSAEGRAVRCLVRKYSDTTSLEELDVELAVGDLASGRSLSRAVDGCELVFHCGALVSDWATTREITRTNVTGTRNLLEASAGASVRRFVHFSTTDVYGHPGTGAIDESFAAQRFSNWYAQTKLRAEHEVRRMEAGGGFDAVILRPATVYGPGSCDVVGGIARAIRDRSMLLIDGGRSDAGLCFVENLLDAALLALENGQARGQAFNVSDDLGVTWRQFTDGLAEGLGFSRVRWSVPYWAANGVGTSLEHGYRLLRRATGVTVRPLLSRQAVQVLGRDQSFSSRRARETLGWEPRIGYAAGLEATVAWLRREYLA